MSDFDTVYLVPKEISELSSRSDVDLTSDFLGLYPIFSSPMQNISGAELVIEMGRNKCFGILHRFGSHLERLDNIAKVSEAKVPYGVAISSTDWEQELDIAEIAVENGAKLICLDLANGYIPQIKQMGERLRNRLGSKIKLMTGNVINAVGAQYAKDSGFDFVRVSIGSGNLCLTRKVTGVGRNALAALKDCSSVDINLVMDGGIKESGDGAKAFACGADFLMLGSILAQSFESENKSGHISGMASFSTHINNGKTIKSIEGRSDQIDPNTKRPLSEILSDFLWGIRSSGTYLNSRSYKDFQYKAQIVPVQESI